MSARLKMFLFFSLLFVLRSGGQTLVITSPSLVCSSSIFTASVTYTGVAGISYSWSASPNLLVQASSGSICSLYAGNCGTAVISCSVFSNSNSLLSQQSLSLQIQCPTLSISPSSASLCGSGTVNFTASGSASYTWNTGASGNTLAVAPSSSTVYSVTGSGAGCPATATVIVQTASITSSAFSLCPAGTVQLSATSANSYNWFQAPGVFMTGGSAQQVTAQPTTLPASYTLFTFFNSGCIRSTTFTIYPFVYAPRVSGATSVCPGGTLSLTGLSASSYTWTNGSQMISSPLFSTVLAMPATFTLWADSAGCNGQKSIAVGIHPRPNVLISSLTNTVCNGQTASLFATGAVNYTWTNAPGLLSSLYGASVIASPISTTIYTVTGISAQACTNTATLPVYFSNYPSVSLFTNVASVCPGYSATGVGQGAVSYYWKGTSLPGTLSGYSLSLPAGNYTLIGSNGAACVDSLVFTIGALPPLTVSVAATASTTCINGDGVVLPVSLVATGAPSYSWQAQPAFTSGTLGGFNIQVSPSVTTCYTVTGYSSSCQGKDTFCIISGQLCTAVVEENQVALVSVKQDVSKNLIRIGTSGQSYQLIFRDISGRTLKWFEIPVGSNTFEMSLENLVPGIYTLEYSTEGQVKNFKIIKP